MPQGGRTWRDGGEGGLDGHHASRAAAPATPAAPPPAVRTSTSAIVCSASAPSGEAVAAWGEGEGGDALAREGDDDGPARGCRPRASAPSLRPPAAWPGARVRPFGGARGRSRVVAAQEALRVPARVVNDDEPRGVERSRPMPSGTRCAGNPLAHPYTNCSCSELARGSSAAVDRPGRHALVGFGAGAGVEAARVPYPLAAPASSGPPRRPSRCHRM